MHDTHGFPHHLNGPAGSSFRHAVRELQPEPSIGLVGWVEVGQCPFLLYCFFFLFFSFLFSASLLIWEVSALY